MANVLEETAEKLKMSPQDLFREICIIANVTAGRFDMFWSAYEGEQFIPDFIEWYCGLIAGEYIKFLPIKSSV